MEWRKPEFEEIDMNAEIGSYQEDEGGRFPYRNDEVTSSAGAEAPAEAGTEFE